jgi:hypothetical protein
MFYFTPIFNGLQVGRFDPFCREVIRFEHGTTTVLLQCASEAGPMKSLLLLVEATV